MECGPTGVTHHSSWPAGSPGRTMSARAEFILGEFPRTLDERFRLSLPPEFAEALLADGPECILAKERPGSLSLWNARAWQVRLDNGVELVRQKMRAGQAGRAARGGAVAQSAALDTTQNGAFGRPRSVVGARRIS